MAKVPSHVFQIGMSALTFPAPEVAQLFVGLANEGDQLAIAWLEEILATKAPSEAWLSRVERLARGVQINTYPKLKESEGKFVWAREFPKPKQFRDREAAMALVVVRLVNADFLNRLHKCQLEDCGTYFVADPRTKWCSVAHGSTKRMREKRKKDRQR
jgi:hypothetical protein